MKKYLHGATPTESGFADGVAVPALGLVWAEASAIDGATGRRVPEAGTIAEETRVCLVRLGETLAEAGYALSDVVKVNCYLAADEDRAEFWTAFDEVLAPGPYPVRITQVGGVAGDARVLLDAVAAR
ncbi:MAG: RidA family protein [Nocardioides sp.]|uniref:RidA family protein n=1 Tax=Nocardioides sp. TaxID=35761 RepID=UPI0039E5D1A6